MRSDCSALGDAVDNGVDRRYERPLIENGVMATIFSAFWTMMRDRPPARKIMVSRTPRRFAFDEAIA